MALAAQSTPHPNWGRWPQQLPQDFSMMEAPGFIPYDSRSTNPAPIQRPMPAQYVVETAYSAAPMQTMPAPHYPSQNAFSYMPYQSPPPSTPISSPYKPEFSERPNHRHAGQDVDNGRMMAYRRDSKVHEALPPSPISRRESVASSLNRFPNPVSQSKTITYNETINPADQVNFGTEVDELMKAIQKKKDAAAAAAAAATSSSSTASGKLQSQTITPAQTPKGEEAQSPVSSGSPAPADGKPKKKWVCDGPSCNKSFVQKTHLDIHRRTHTGHKPYVCNKDNCGLTFSQRGNLKTHMRRHTGEKPYSCSLCGKLFAQRGNVRSHEETHKGLKPFVCRLDDCNKTFSQLGNMKTHQNNFHKETLQRLTSMFVKFVEDGEVPDHFRDLFDYFQDHYKNSNKGIKGRGKARTVAARKPKTAAPQSTVSSAPVAPQYSHTSIGNRHTVMPNQARLPVYEMSHGPSNVEMPRNPNHVYGMFDHQQQSQHQGAPQGGMMYEDEHSRQMGFTSRLY